MPVRPVPQLSFRSPYDPWRDLSENWPGVTIEIVQMTGDLLGEIRESGTVIALRAGTSSGQRRCTLAHEIIHLERGIGDCGLWQLREERQVHIEVARRLIPAAVLCEAARVSGGAADPRALALTLDVDVETLRIRLACLARTEARAIRRKLAGSSELWALA